MKNKDKIKTKTRKANNTKSNPIAIRFFYNTNIIYYPKIPLPFAKSLQKLFIGFSFDIKIQFAYFEATSHVW